VGVLEEEEDFDMSKGRKKRGKEGELKERERRVSERVQEEQGIFNSVL